MSSISATERTKASKLSCCSSTRQAPFLQAVPQTILPGGAVSFDFAFRTLGTNEGRIQLRSVVCGTTPFKAIRNLKMSVEVFDEDTGKTAVFVENFSSGEVVL